VTFQTSDGVTLEGRRFGTGEDFVVLAHMLPASMESWFDFAAVLADEGYSAIAFNFRGYGNSEGDGFSVSTDATAAFDLAMDAGAARVFGIGASMGGTGVLASNGNREFVGVASLSAPAVFEGSDAVGGVATATAPLLLIAAEDDAPYPEEADTIRAVRPDAEVLILTGSRHGTDLFIDHGDELEAALLEFLAAQG
jgi:pimeloyl-ACP methyl ester carboxylesterase